MSSTKLKKILVCGGRDYNDRDRVFDELNILRMDGPVAIINGDAKGADQISYEWAEITISPVVLHPPKWHEHGKKAGVLRNQEMLDMWDPDIVLAFPGGKGTADMVKRSKDQGYEVKEIDG